MTYGIARFFAGGGTGTNYYMFHGGTNFARESMYLQTPSYDFDGLLDEYGLETTKYHALASLHHLLADHAAELLSQVPPAPQSLGDKQFAYTYAAASAAPLTFLCNDDDTAPAKVSFAGRNYELARQSVQILSGSQVVLDTARVETTITRRMERIATLGDFERAAEPLPAHRASTPLTAPEPIEQLRLTRDGSDYCWYSSTFTSTSPTVMLVLDGVADFVSVYVDGTLHATTPTPLVENRTLKDHKDFTQTFALTLPPGEHRLDLLCCAMGLIKGDWMLGFQNMTQERKGLFGRALLDGRVLTDWTMHPMLEGERALPTTFASGVAAAAPLWLRTTFARPDTAHPLALDLLGQTKGLIFLNGRCLSRYWLLEATIANPISPFPAMVPAGLGEPTQRYYHVPRSWLADENELVLFSELPGAGATVRLCERI
jgi:beta-galactosidase